MLAVSILYVAEPPRTFSMTWPEGNLSSSITVVARLVNRGLSAAPARSEDTRSLSLWDWVDIFVSMLAVVVCVVVSAPPSIEGCTAVSRYDGVYMRGCIAYSLTFDVCRVHPRASLLTTNILKVMEGMTLMGPLTHPSDTVDKLEMYADLGAYQPASHMKNFKDSYHIPGSVMLHRRIRALCGLHAFLPHHKWTGGV